jgi:hypothetical protein
VAKQRRRKKQLAVLDGPGTSTPRMFFITCEFYKTLFGFETKPNIHLGSDIWDSSDLVSLEEKSLLKQLFLQKK